MIIDYVFSTRHIGQSNFDTNHFILHSVYFFSFIYIFLASRAYHEYNKDIIIIIRYGYSKKATKI